MIWLELLVVLVCIFVGARLGGISLGTVAGIGLVVLVFVFGLPPGLPPRWAQPHLELFASKVIPAFR